MCEYVIKVTLSNVKGVSRTIAARGDHTLHDLHGVLFEAFERYDDHLYSYYIPKAARGPRAGQPSPKEYTAPEMFSDGISLVDAGQIDASKTSLDSLGLKNGQRFEYLFDFGDSWWHELSVEEIRPAAPQSVRPVIVKSEGEAPPQYEDVDDENYFEDEDDDEE